MLSMGRSVTIVTMMPDSYMGVLGFDHLRQSVSKTYDRIANEAHLVFYFYAAGFAFFQLF